MSPSLVAEKNKPQKLKEPPPQESGSAVCNKKNTSEKTYTFDCNLR